MTPALSTVRAACSATTREGELVCQVQSSNDDPEKALSDAYQDHINYLNHAWRMGK